MNQNLKRLLLILFGVLTIPSIVFSQAVCNASSTGFVPVSDLGKGMFVNAWNESWQGGLYPGGSNKMPEEHKLAGLLLAGQVRRVDANGNPDALNGKIVWLSIGMSNTTQETQQFISLANAFQNRNQGLKFVDGAQGGMTAGIISTPGSSGYSTFWNTVSSRLTSGGATAAQVQVIWLKEADAAGNTPLRSYYDSLYTRHIRILHEIRARFPNAKLCYISSRISGRYASSTLNPEPYAYYSGWVVKKVIEEQINGNSQLRFSGSGANSPWIAWGPYFWSDGSTPQKTDPEVFWKCPADFQSDGTHPSSPEGAGKAGTLLLNFFSKDSTTQSWFLKQGVSSLASLSGNRKYKCTLVPNPFSVYSVLRTGISFRNATLVVFNSSGQKVRQLDNLSGDTFTIFREDLTEGAYFLQLTQDEDVLSTLKMVITE